MAVRSHGIPRTPGSGIRINGILDEETTYPACGTIMKRL